MKRAYSNANGYIVVRSYVSNHRKKNCLELHKRGRRCCRRQILSQISKPRPVIMQAALSFFALVLLASSLPEGLAIRTSAVGGGRKLNGSPPCDDGTLYPDCSDGYSCFPGENGSRIAVVPSPEHEVPALGFSPRCSCAFSRQRTYWAVCGLSRRWSC